MNRNKSAAEKRPKHAGWRMSRRERFWYYFGDIGRSFGAQVITSFMTVFLLFQGISMTSVAGIVLIVKVIDAVDDVVFGFFVDRLDPTKIPLFSKLAGKGKYLPWYRCTFFLFPIATILFFLMPSGIPEGMKLVWFGVFYLLYDLTCTLAEVPMNSMIVTLTDNMEERSGILKVKGVVVTLGTVAIAVLYQVLVSEAVGLPVKGVAICAMVIYFLMMIPLAFKVTEHNTVLKNAAVEKEERYSFKDMLGCVKTNKYMLIVLLSCVIYACTQTGTAITNFVAFYLMGNSLITTIPMLIALPIGLVIQANADKIRRKLGSRNSLLVFTLAAGIGYLILWLMGYSNVTLVIAVSTVACIPGAVRAVLTTFIYPDTIEYTRYKTGKDCSGIFYSLNSFVNKATAGVSSSLALFILGLSGWVAVEATDFADLAAQGVAQPQSALDCLWALNGLIPAIGMLLSAGLLFLYKLKDSDAQLMARCNSGEITRKECEAKLSRKY